MRIRCKRQERIKGNLIFDDPKNGLWWIRLDSDNDIGIDGKELLPVNPLAWEEVPLSPFNQRVANFNRRIVCKDLKA